MVDVANVIPVQVDIAGHFDPSVLAVPLCVPDY